MPYPDLADLERAPLRLIRPDEQRWPFVFASPHSGRCYPDAFVSASALTPVALRRSEDAYVDELFDGVAALGCPLIAAEFPRAYVDANRAAGEIDAEMFEGTLPAKIEAPGPRVRAGLGVVPRVVRDGVEIYRGKLPATEAERRLTRLYRPYHAALSALVEATWRRFGCAVVIDCHSMPSVPSVPEIVLGDCHGTAASPALMRHVDRAFSAQGFETARNAPYAGGFTTHLYARRDLGIHALQIEINRALYLDEDRIVRSARFAGIRGRIQSAMRDLMTFDTSLLRPQQPMAAE